VQEKDICYSFPVIFDTPVKYELRSTKYGMRMIECAVLRASYFVLYILYFVLPASYFVFGYWVQEKDICYSFPVIFDTPVKYELRSTGCV
jgi:hypothetical protein